MTKYTRSPSRPDLAWSAMRPMPSRSSASNRTRPPSRVRRSPARTLSQIASRRESAKRTHAPPSIADRPVGLNLGCGESGVNKRPGTREMLILHGAGGEAGHVIVDEERVDDRDRHRAEQR